MGTVIIPGGSDAEEGITDSTPILPESQGVRTNFAVLPGGLEAMIDVKLDMGDARAQGLPGRHSYHCRCYDVFLGCRPEEIVVVYNDYSTVFRIVIKDYFLLGCMPQ